MDLFGFQLSGKKLDPVSVSTVNISFLFHVASFHYCLLSTRVLPARGYRSLPCNCGQEKIVQMIIPHTGNSKRAWRKTYMFMHAAFKRWQTTPLPVQTESVRVSKDQEVWACCFSGVPAVLWAQWVQYVALVHHATWCTTHSRYKKKLWNEK